MSVCISRWDIQEAEAIAKLFRSNRSQAVRLPKEAEFPAGVDEVDVVAHGNIRILVPRISTWREWFEKGPHVSDDFLTEMEDSPPQERDFKWR